METNGLLFHILYTPVLRDSPVGFVTVSRLAERAVRCYLTGIRTEASERHPEASDAVLTVRMTSPLS